MIEVAEPGRFRVDVLVDLEWEPAAGGHVKCWERIAEAATRLDGGLDLTLHFSGRERGHHLLSEHVRYQIHRPMFSTARLPFLSHVPDHTDLAPYHPGLARTLLGSAVIHTTDAYFAFAKTALAVARRRRIALVNSVHTDTPRYGRVFTAETIENLARNRWLARLLLDRLHVDQWTERRMLARLANYQQSCNFSLVSRPAELDALARLVGPDRAGLMRRGIDCRRFDPQLRDRAWLETRFGIAQDRLVVLFVGRVNVGKDVMTLAAAVRALVDQGLPVHLLCAGAGEQVPEVLALLGPHASCPGVLCPEILARAYASADIFASPSRIEVLANVVMEALASGLPTLVAADSGMARMLHEGRTGYAIADGGPPAWSAAIRALATDPAGRRVMAEAARTSALTELPSWDDVLVQDLLPVWRRLAAAANS
ncbi:MAG: glycosyltransferase [Rhodospirillaceae bacterium]